MESHFQFQPSFMTNNIVLLALGEGGRVLFTRKSWNVRFSFKQTILEELALSGWSFLIVSFPNGVRGGWGGERRHFVPWIPSIPYREGRLSEV
jgi:hypothetical protein